MKKKILKLWRIQNAFTLKLLKPLIGTQLIRTKKYPLLNKMISKLKMSEQNHPTMCALQAQIGSYQRYPPHLSKISLLKMGFRLRTRGKEIFLVPELSKKYTNTELAPSAVLNNNLRIKSNKARCRESLSMDAYKHCLLLAKLVLSSNQTTKSW